WPVVDIVVRGDSHYARPEAMAWCECKRIGYILGLAGNTVLLGRVSALAEDAVLGWLSGEADKVRRYGEFRYAAKSWRVERRVIARVEAGPQCRQPLHRDQLGRPAQGALRKGLLCEGTGRE